MVIIRAVAGWLNCACIVVGSSLCSQVSDGRAGIVCLNVVVCLFV